MSRKYLFVLPPRRLPYETASGSIPLFTLLRIISEPYPAGMPCRTQLSKWCTCKIFVYAAFYFLKRRSTCNRTVSSCICWHLPRERTVVRSCGLYIELFGIHAEEVQRVDVSGGFCSKESTCGDSSTDTGMSTWVWQEVQCPAPCLSWKAIVGRNCFDW